MSRSIPPSDDAGSSLGSSAGSPDGVSQGSVVVGLPPAGRASASAVSSRLRTLASVSQGYADRVSRHLDVHRSDLSAMSVIAASAARGQSTSAGQLARRLLMSPAAVTALVDRLERAGHVRRHRDERDRRRVVLGLTGYAGQVSGVMFRPLSHHLQEALSAYSDEELDLVARVLDDAVAATRRALAEPLPEVPEAHEPYLVHETHETREAMTMEATTGPGEHAVGQHPGPSPARTSRASHARALRG